MSESTQEKPDKQENTLFNDEDSPEFEQKSRQNTISAASTSKASSLDEIMGWDSPSQSLNASPTLHSAPQSAMEFSNIFEDDSSEGLLARNAMQPEPSTLSEDVHHRSESENTTLQGSHLGSLELDEASIFDEMPDVSHHANIEQGFTSPESQVLSSLFDDSESSNDMFMPVKTFVRQECDEEIKFNTEDPRKEEVPAVDQGTILHPDEAVPANTDADSDIINRTHRSAADRDSGETLMAKVSKSKARKLEFKPLALKTSFGVFLYLKTLQYRATDKGQLQKQHFYFELRRVLIPLLEEIHSKNSKALSLMKVPKPELSLSHDTDIWVLSNSVSSKYFGVECKHLFPSDMLLNPSDLNAAIMSKDPRSSLINLIFERSTDSTALLLHTLLGISSDAPVTPPAIDPGYLPYIIKARDARVIKVFLDGCSDFMAYFVLFYRLGLITIDDYKYYFYNNLYRVSLLKDLGCKTYEHELLPENTKVSDKGWGISSIVNLGLSKILDVDSTEKKAEKFTEQSAPPAKAAEMPSAKEEASPVLEDVPSAAEPARAQEAATTQEGSLGGYKRSYSKSFADIFTLGQKQEQESHVDASSYVEGVTEEDKPVLQRMQNASKSSIFNLFGVFKKKDERPPTASVPQARPLRAAIKVPEKERIVVKSAYANKNSPKIQIPGVTSIKKPEDEPRTSHK